jgi:hypothetical protein
VEPTPETDEPQPGGEVDIDPPEAARAAIWQLFEDGLLDENMATAGLLAVDIGMRRSRQTRR